jgi:deoxyribose-phosphate aldolase
MSAKEKKRAAERALACLDLTNLDERCTSGDIDALCRRAQTPRGPVAAVCVYPRFASQARSALEGTGIKVATVVNFPTGDRPADFVSAMTSDALEQGAEEIDLVVPWAALKSGNEAAVRDIVRMVRRIAPVATLKAILETGKLGEADLITLAARIAVDEGADFLKTSTGKVEVNATLEAAECLLRVIERAKRPVGLKPAGGVRTTDDAAGYLALCDRVMGESWAGPATFRIGASGLLTALLATLDDGTAPGPGDVY